MPPPDEPNADQTFEMLSFIGSGRGGRKPSSPFSVEILRPIEQADLVTLANPTEVGVGTPAVARLRHSHHQVARLLAEGRKNVEVSAIMGMSQSRISILRNDPAFQELITYYAGQAADQYVDVHSRLARLGTDAVEELQARLDENGEALSFRQVKELAEFALDRSVAPPKRGAGQDIANGQPAAPTININFVKSESPFTLPALPQAPQGTLIDSTATDPAEGGGAWTVGGIKRPTQPD